MNYDMNSIVFVILPEFKVLRIRIIQTVLWNKQIF